MRAELLREGVLAISGNRWSDGYAWCELRPAGDGGRHTLNLRLIWASECRKGYGTALLDKLTRAADRCGTRLYLEVQPFIKGKSSDFDFSQVRQDGMLKPELCAWYEKHGFRRLDDCHMARDPAPRPGVLE